MKKKNVLRRLTAILGAALLLPALVCPALAYSSPFDPPEKAEYAAPGEPAVLNYSLREGGKFLYCNNPEIIRDADTDKVLMLEKNISGDVYFTAEHNNQTGKRLFFGLQLRNRSGKPISVTVKNLGYQTGGDWCGQTEWSDFFGLQYDIQHTEDEFHFTEVKKPNPFTETTYEIPNGEYFYVCGGSTFDAYEHINVGGSANRPVEHGSILNVACYFTVDAPAKGVDAAFVCYRSASFPVTDSKQQGYVTVRDDVQYGLQYLGSAPYLCAECAVGWEVDDTVADGRLQTVYQTTSYKNADTGKPYEKYTDPQERTVKMYGWKTHLNPNWDSSYVGTDMMPLACVTDGGKSVVIDTNHTDGVGKAANIGNWMVVYEERLSFKNSGSKARTFTVNISLKGILAMNVKNAAGEILKAYYHSVPGEVYTLELAPGEEDEVVLEYTLTANSYGGLTHAVVLGTVEEKPDVSEDSEVSEQSGDPEESAEVSEAVESSESAESTESAESGAYKPLKDDGTVSAWAWILAAAVVLIGAGAVWLGRKK